LVHHGTWPGASVTGIETGQGKADYGIDAPGVVRNLFVAGALALIIWLSVALHAWSGQLRIPIPGVTLIMDMFGTSLILGLVCLGMGAWMLWDSLVGKLQVREALLDRTQWTGAEEVLDVGCGRGLMLIGAAKRLTTGRAIGIDIWQEEDLSGNRLDAFYENARREGVIERVKVETADMRKMPFADSSFDVIVSRAAIHNLYKPEERQQAISEIVRVLKPGGTVIIDDIRHIDQYAQRFATCGCIDVLRGGSALMALVLMLLTFGSLRPGSLVVRKPV
jgi:arsenite methyltransferase